jgi:hypothetical protein
MGGSRPEEGAKDPYMTLGLGLGVTPAESHLS